MKVRPDGGQEYTAAEQLEKMMNRTTKKYIRQAAAQHAEQARRLARYDEAIGLLRLESALAPGSALRRGYERSRDSFLDAEPTPDKGRKE